MLYMEIYVKFVLFPYYFVLVFKHDFIRCVDFTVSLLQTWHT